jgi:6-pyruvoyltetrahydropterin/6-carboxytetrahydropterin synthase
VNIVGGAIRVRHNIEVAHRLSLLPGKCENIHGHSMWVELELTGAPDERGLSNGLDFGGVKRAFRGMLDSEFDHHLLLNAEDELAKLDLPGARLCVGDPTTENIARWVLEWAQDEFGPIATRVDVHETHVNSATARMVVL